MLIPSLTNPSSRSSFPPSVSLPTLLVLLVVLPLILRPARGCADEPSELFNTARYATSSGGRFNAGDSASIAFTVRTYATLYDLHVNLGYKSQYYHYNESVTSGTCTRGTGGNYRQFLCDGARQCSEQGVCHGTARPSSRLQQGTYSVLLTLEVISSPTSHVSYYKQYAGTNDGKNPLVAMDLTDLPGAPVYVEPWQQVVISLRVLEGVTIIYGSKIPSYLEATASSQYGDQFYPAVRLTACPEPDKLELFSTRPYAVNRGQRFGAGDTSALTFVVDAADEVLWPGEKVALRELQVDMGYKNQHYTYDESQTAIGAARCTPAGTGGSGVLGESTSDVDFLCDGVGYCTAFGWCHGTPRPSSELMPAFYAIAMTINITTTASNSSNNGSSSSTSLAAGSNSNSGVPAVFSYRKTYGGSSFGNKLVPLDLRQLPGGPVYVRAGQRMTITLEVLKQGTAIYAANVPFKSGVVASGTRGGSFFPSLRLMTCPLPEEASRVEGSACWASTLAPISTDSHFPYMKCKKSDGRRSLERGSYYLQYSYSAAAKDAERGDALNRYCMDIVGHGSCNPDVYKCCAQDIDRILWNIEPKCHKVVRAAYLDGKRVRGISYTPHANASRMVLKLTGLKLDSSKIVGATPHELCIDLPAKPTSAGCHTLAGLCAGAACQYAVVNPAGDCCPVGTASKFEPSSGVDGAAGGAG